jgi:2-iminobutanoate/2-iminopropanoate deaminase
VLVAVPLAAVIAVLAAAHGASPPRPRPIMSWWPRRGAWTRRSSTIERWCQGQIEQQPSRQGAHLMPREVISTPEAPEYPSYSQAVKVGDTIYVAGTIGVDVATGELAGHTIKEQTRQSLRNCQAILRAGGAELSDAVMVHTLLLRPEDADGVMEVFDEFFPGVRPPRCVSKLGVDRPGILVSIAMVAVTG